MSNPLRNRVARLEKRVAYLEDQLYAGEPSKVEAEIEELLGQPDTPEFPAGDGADTLEGGSAAETLEGAEDEPAAPAPKPKPKKTKAKNA